MALGPHFTPGGTGWDVDDDADRLREKLLVRGLVVVAIAAFRRTNGAQESSLLRICWQRN